MRLLRRLFEEREEDKINREILNDYYPVVALEKYYLFGFANALSMLTDYANNYINGNYADKLDAYDLKKIINELAVSNRNLREMYYRLRKDGVKTKLEEMN